VPEIRRDAVTVLVARLDTILAHQTINACLAGRKPALEGEISGEAQI
jgi:hypothetical protein